MNTKKSNAKSNPKSKNKRKTCTDCHALAKSKGFEWLGPLPKNNKAKTFWQCGKGHERQAAYYSVFRHNCPFCSGVIRKTQADYHILSADKGFKWLGPEVSNIQTRTWWECRESHQWQANYNNVRKGSGCPFCSGVVRKTVEDYHILAKQKGFKWIGPLPENTKGKTWWECSKGHRWEVSYSCIVQNRNGCRSCSKYALKTIEDYQTLATERGFKLIGDMPNSVTVAVEWQCSQNHKWQANFDSIRRGSGCPICNESRGETETAHILEILSISYEREKSFNDCRDKHPLPFDFYFALNNKHYLVEYQGQQHYHTIPHFGGKQALQATQRRDEIKDQYAKDNGYHLIVIPYTQFENIEQIIKNETKND